MIPASGRYECNGKVTQSVDEPQSLNSTVGSPRTIPAPAARRYGTGTAVADRTISNAVQQAGGADKRLLPVAFSTLSITLAAHPRDVRLLITLLPMSVLESISMKKLVFFTLR